MAIVNDTSLDASISTQRIVLCLNLRRFSHLGLFKHRFHPQISMFNPQREKWVSLSKPPRSDRRANPPTPQSGDRPPGALPVLAGGAGVRGLVGVARVLRLVVHVVSGGGRRRAGLAGPSPSAQLTLALGDGPGGEDQRQLEQVDRAS